MSTVWLTTFGWLVPGGAYLLMRRYVPFAIFAVVVLSSLGAGLGLDGGCRWPTPEELAGLDGFTALVFQAGAFAKFLAGGPYLLAQLSGNAGTLLSSRVHDYGSTLLVMAGLFNLLAISSALELRKERKG
jgi:hypothetical protein